MIWTRQELKDKAKVAFKRNYWRCVLVGLIWTVVTGFAASSSTGSSSGSDGTSTLAQLQILADGYGVSLQTIILTILAIVGVSLVISTLLNVFLQNPFAVGTERFFLKNAYEPAAVNDVTYSFTGGRYFKTVGTMFLKDLFVGLWSILFVIPGIIAAYNYYLVEFIMADDPQISAMDALRKSKEMMRGHRWNVFVLNLSFIGWLLLGTITCGVLDIFYVIPYMKATDAELYLKLKNQ